MSSNKNAAEAMRSAIWTGLDLESHSIVFHILDAGNGEQIAAGSVFERLDLETSDAFLAAADDYDSEPALAILNVTTYMIGDGESDTATAAEVRELERFRDSAPDVFNRMLYDSADVLAAIDDITVPNPYYFDD